MDSSVIVKIEQPKRQRRSIAEKHRIVELTMHSLASIARVSREHGINANMVHYWRKLYREGRLGENKGNSVRLLPVTVSESPTTAVVEPVTKLASPSSAVLSPSSTGSIYIEFPKIHLRIESGADAALLRLVPQQRLLSRESGSSI